MAVDIKIPGVGESVREAVLVQWYKKDGAPVHKDEPLLVIETDKVTLEITAQQDGILHILVPEAAVVSIGQVVGAIETEAALPGDLGRKGVGEPVRAPEPAAQQGKTAAPPAPVEKGGPPAPVSHGAGEADYSDERQTLSPSVRRLVSVNSVDARQVRGTGPGGRITKGDVLLYLEQKAGSGGEAQGGPLDVRAPFARTPSGTEGALPPDTTLTHRKPMSPIRLRIAERLLEAKQNTAMLTTFNEIDMSRVMALRSSYQEDFRNKHGIFLGLMSFFVRAAVEALKQVPELNAFIEGKEIVYHDYCHMGVAIGAERGLVVPVIRHADRLGFAQIERAIARYVEKVEANRLELSDLEGGTFTISNGGVYGSLLSTPLLNVPQSGILGMHKIEKRPVVAEDDRVVVRPMMYVALSYDHRLVDGRGAVTCLKRIKELVENPERMMMEI